MLGKKSNWGKRKKKGEGDRKEEKKGKKKNLEGRFHNPSKPKTFFAHIL